MWNIGSLSGKGGEVFEELRKRIFSFVICGRRDGEDRVLRCWGWKEGDTMCGGGTEKEMELAVWKLL